MNEIFFRLFRNIALSTPNAVLSPFCMDLVLNILYNGTSGNIQNNVRKLLDQNYPPDDFASLRIRLDSLIDESISYAQSNHLSYRWPIELNEEFISTVQDSLNLEVENLDKSSDNIFLILKSKFNLSCKWYDRFYDTTYRVEAFHLESGKNSRTEYIEKSNIRGNNDIGYLERINFQAIQIPMTASNLFLEVLLPNKDSNINNLLTTLDNQTILSMINAYDHVDNLEVVLPKFEVNLDARLKDSLIDLGLQELFKDSTTDFHPMVKGNLPIYIDEIKQDTSFKLDEYGIEAESVTEVLFGIRGIPPKQQKYILFEANRPFIYLLRNITTNDILFIGALNNPSSSNEIYNSEVQQSLAISVVRKFKPKLFNITIRGQLYLGLTCLNIIVKSEIECPKVVKKWAHAASKLLTQDQENIEVFCKTIYFGSELDLTGYFEPNPYFKKHEYVQFENDFYLIIGAMKCIDYLISNAKYLSEESHFLFSPFTATSNLLSFLVENKIELPDLDQFTTYRVIDGNSLGDIIEIDPNNIGHLI